MANKVRRATPLLSALLLGAVAWLLVTLASGPSAQRSFIGTGSTASTPTLRGKTAMHGFKEDFESWRSSLTAEERSLLLDQASGEFNKAFRKTEAFKKDLPAEKISAFSKILGKFFDDDNDEAKIAEKSVMVPDYDGLLKKAGDKKMDFSLRAEIVMIDRDADRRYNFASEMAERAESGGFKFPQSSPLEENWMLLNNETKSHEFNTQIIEFMKLAKDQPNCPPAAKLMIDEWVKKGVPPMGEDFELSLPAVMINQHRTLEYFFSEMFKDLAVNSTEAQLEEVQKDFPELYVKAVNWLVENYVTARDEVEGYVTEQKEFFRSQAERKDKSLTKADILKEIWEELPKHVGEELAPLDEETIAELAQEPAIQEGEYMHSWGTADKLYKSEAIDSFGMRYLLGVFETKEEALMAFKEWNVEYEKARGEMQNEMSQWSKAEQARLDKNSEGTDRIKKLLEEVRR